jgi:hypothetical protein
MKSEKDRYEQAVQTFSYSASFFLGWKSLLDLPIQYREDAVTAFGERRFGAERLQQVCAQMSADDEDMPGYSRILRLVAATAFLEGQRQPAAAANPQPSTPTSAQLEAAGEVAPTDAAKEYRKLFHPGEDEQDALLTKMELATDPVERNKLFAQWSQAGRTDKHPRYTR